MESRSIKVKSRINPRMSISVIPGHFATNHSHVSHYIDITGIKHHSKAAQLAAEELLPYFSGSVAVDTIICMDGCEMVGAYLAKELSQSGAHSLSADSDISVLTPEFNANGQMVFRDNLQPMLWGKGILLLIASATTGKTITRSLDCVRYYGGRAVGIAAVFSAIQEMAGMPVVSVFTQEDVPGYETFLPAECPSCKQQVKIDAIVSSSGYTKIE